MFFLTNRVVSQRGIVAGLVFALFMTVLGCGSSQDDMMMRAARRTRDPDPEDAPRVASPVPAPGTTAVVASASVPSAVSVATAPAVAGAPATEAKPSFGQVYVSATSTSQIKRSTTSRFGGAHILLYPLIGALKSRIGF